MATIEQAIEKVIELGGYDKDDDKIEQILLDCWTILEMPFFDNLRKELMKK